MKKRILSIWLVLCILASFLPVVTASAATEGIYAYFVSNGEATITECNQSARGAITIPDTLGGYPVTSIGDDAFFKCTSLTDIAIPDSVTSIGEWTFSACTSLTNIIVSKDNPKYASINGNLFNKNKTTLIQYAIGKDDSSYSIPNSVTSIGDFAFEYCRSLTNITLPNSVTSIGYGAFGNCRSLTNITLPNSVTSIGNYAFGDCTSLTNITIPDGVISIGRDAFSGCTSLTNITLPNSVTSIGYCAFEWCISLTDVYYTGSEEQWKKISIEGDNENLTNATIHYNYVPKDNKKSIVLSETTISANPYTCRSIFVYKEDGVTKYDKSFKATSSNPKAVSTSVKGNEIILTFKSSASAIITVTATDGSGEKANCDVVVNEPVDSEERELLERLALCQLVYSNNLIVSTKDKVSKVGDERQKANKSTSMFHRGYGQSIPWGDFYKNYINDYKVINLPKNPEMGFYAAAFESPDEDIIIAYRGSEGSGFAGVFKFLQNKEKQKKNVDWWGTNLGMFTGLNLSSQFTQALRFYDEVKKNNPNKNITLTGHSLGGALASYVSINRDVRCENVNGATGWLFNNNIFCNPNNYLVDFIGFDKNVFEHFNDHPDFKNKPVTRFANLNTFNYTMYEDSKDYNILSKKELINDEIVYIPEKDYHKISSIINYNYGQFAPTAIKRKYNIKNTFVDVGNHNYIGTSKNESITKCATTRMKFPGTVASYLVPVSCYAIGGGGDDSISFTSGGDDVLIGNSGNDTLNGGAGNDTYVYGGNFGNDTIIDPSGKDKILFTDVSLSDLIIAGAKITCGSNTIEISSKSKRREKFTVVDKNNKTSFIVFQNARLFGLEGDADYNTTKGIQVLGNAEVEIYNSEGELIEILSTNEETRESVEYKDYGMVAYEPQTIGLTLPPDGYIVKVKADKTVSVWTVSDADEPTLARQTFIENMDLSDGSHIVINTGEFVQEQLSVKHIGEEEQDIYSQVPENLTITADKTAIKTGEEIIMSVSDAFAESVVWECTNDNVIISKNEDMTVSIMGYTTGEETVRAYLPNDELYLAEYSFTISEDSAPKVVVSSKEEIYDGTEVATDSVFFDVTMAEGYDTVVFDTMSPYSQVEDTNTFVINSVGKHTVAVYCKNSVTGASTASFTFEFTQDSEAPEILGAEEQGTYYVDRVISVSDASLKEVYLNGELMEEDTFIVSESGSYTITAKDEAGNIASLSFEIKAIPAASEIKLSDAETVAKIRDDFEEVKYSLATDKMDLLEAQIGELEERINFLSDAMNPKCEITDFTATPNGEKTEITLTIKDVPTDAGVYVVSYNIAGAIAELQKLTVVDGKAKAEFAADSVAFYKAFVWTDKLRPLAKTKECK